MVGRAPEQVLESSVSPTDRAGHPWGAGRWWFAACGLNAVCSFQLAPKLSKQVLQVHPGGRLGVPSVTECACLACHESWVAPHNQKTLLVAMGCRFLGASDPVGPVSTLEARHYTRPPTCCSKSSPVSCWFPRKKRRERPLRTSRILNGF